ncbi:Probable carboxyvinyl-carboxyphosphonate phosphorylmutase [[Actinomadura] parvosata subsp. kistnae]|uniref:Carboxyvinyl-carboxyphosphonate phosphorylmutase n=1 Tax=[Actinomadura] parvosata subsp. kistnae TaxID=1909395 RepID=A0A1V0A6F2_9ACTN|nr:isocitrate lyase/phosphoenolpyruvate mutase family protein [Nonomuraea sp. ATCC 55076]AQZ65749.1 carboxyvinyl-carboxyphosphonate phosphorylmutase [Nonomuraea sp. ATCC 55076]SPL97153.1 Probable carboxyvinyl-carboxyphosphonate phosphorylmutase [Actinomadura parvosata subsp. kistnae]
MTTDDANALRALHVPGTPLVLPNVWDAASARAVREAGFPAVATSSAAVARALGYDDGERTPVAEMMTAVARVARAAEGVPVTADIERGYGLKPAELVERLAEAGAAGCNLEDSLPGRGDMVDPGEQAAFLAEVRAAAGDALVINARIDLYLRGPASRAEAVARGRRYLEAGADCVYPIGLADADEIRALVGELGAPVNVYFSPRTPSLAALAGLGVARISFGSGLHQAVQELTRGMLAKVRDGRSPY